MYSFSVDAVPVAFFEIVAATDCHDPATSLVAEVTDCSPDQLVFEIATRVAIGWMKNWPVDESPEPPMFHRNLLPDSAVGLVSMTIVAAFCPASRLSGSLTWLDPVNCMKPPRQAAPPTTVASRPAPEVSCSTVPLVSEKSYEASSEAGSAAFAASGPDAASAPVTRAALTKPARSFLLLDVRSACGR